MGLFVIGDGSDDGTTLTWPNRVVAEGDATATGAGRPAISTTACDGLPGLDFASHSVTLKATLSGMAGATASTVIVLLHYTGTAGGCIYRIGDAEPYIRTLINNVSLWRYNVQRFTTDDSTIQYRGREPIYASAICARHDAALGSGQDFPLWIDGDEMPVLVGDTPVVAATALSTGVLYIGENGTAGSSRFQGAIAGIAVLRRALTDAEVETWTQWLRAECGFATAKDVMWLGDSITESDTVLRANWRKRIWDLYEAESAIDEVRWYRARGAYKVAVPTWDFDYSHSTGGWLCATAEAALATQFVGTRYQPDIVPMLIGTNDLNSGSVTDLLTAYGSLVDELHARLPNARLVAQKLLPRGDSGTIDAKVTDWNANYHDAFVAAKAAEGIDIISDDTLRTLSDGGGITYVTDGVHPDAACADDMGDALWPALKTWAGIP